MLEILECLVPIWERENHDGIGERRNYFQEEILKERAGMGPRVHMGWSLRPSRSWHHLFQEGEQGRSQQAQVTGRGLVTGAAV